MSSSPEELHPGNWIAYCDRPEWADVTPLPQDDGPNPVVQIAYTDRFKDVYDFFRAVLKSGEKSERVLALTEDALELNPANYTVWHYRREVLKAINSDLKAELKYCRDIIEDHPKNYQVWQHRRVLVEWLNDPGNELRFTELILAQDQKNYHAWQHRQWVLGTFKLFDEELSFIDRLLTDDIRNNSAWNQRFFVHSRTGGWDRAAVEKEVKFALDKIQLVKRNESAWNYLRGVLDACTDSDCANEQRELVDIKCRALLAEGCDSPYLLGFLVELIQWRLESEQDDAKASKLVSEAEDLCKRLSCELDVIRARYWTFIQNTISKKYGRSD